MLDIPVNYHVLDEYAPCERWGEPDLRRPEPADDAFMALIRDHYRRAASWGRVALTGSDGDTLLDEFPVLHFAALRRSRQFGRLAGALASYAWTLGTPPPLGLRTAVRRWWTRSPEPVPEFPNWIDEGMATRLDLRSRWRQMNSPARIPTGPRPRAEWALSSPQWTYLFESRDPGVTRILLEVRHTMTDLRLVEYTLSIPAVPWCMKKTILREAMRGLLPEPVRLRKRRPSS
jgi:hypothetical protein